MSSYVDSALLPDEKLILRGEVHWIIFIYPVCLAMIAVFVHLWTQQALLGAMVGIFSAWEMVKAAVYFLTTELAVTDKRVIAKFGFIKRDTFELNVNRVTSLNVDQTVLGRILNYGDITVVGMGGSKTPIPAITDPLAFRRWMLTEVQESKM